MPHLHSHSQWPELITCSVSCLSFHVIMPLIVCPQVKYRMNNACSGLDVHQVVVSTNLEANHYTDHLLELPFYMYNILVY